MGQGFSCVSCGKPRLPPDRAWDRPNPVAIFSSSMGDFYAEIYMDRVPKTASNFIDLCQVATPLRQPSRCSILQPSAVRLLCTKRHSHR